MRAVCRPVLTSLLAATAAATVAVELLNWSYAPEHGFGLAVRTGWALLRSFGFLILIWHVRRGRAAAKPLGLILAVTTVFAVGRLIVPRSGVPPLPGAIGFALLTASASPSPCCSTGCPPSAPTSSGTRNRLVVDRGGIGWREAAPRRPAATGGLLTGRVAAFTYSPLMLVPALVSPGQVVDDQLDRLPDRRALAGVRGRRGATHVLPIVLPGPRAAVGRRRAARGHPRRPGRRPPAVRVAARPRRPGPRRRSAARRGAAWSRALSSGAPVRAVGGRRPGACAARGVDTGG